MDDRMRIAYIAFAGMALLSGCATSPVPSSQADPVPASRLMAFQKVPASPYGTLVVTRDSGFTGSACNTILYIDGNRPDSTLSRANESSGSTLLPYAVVA